MCTVPLKSKLPASCSTGIASHGTGMQLAFVHEKRQLRFEW